MKTKKNFFDKSTGRPVEGKRGKKTTSSDKANKNSFFTSKDKKGKSDSEKDATRAQRGDNYRLKKESRKQHDGNFGDKKTEKSSFFVAKERREFFDENKTFEAPKTERAAPKDGKIRLNKFISNAGVCSRREADELITQGMIAVNGVTITELGYKVHMSDKVQMGNKILKAEHHVYVLLNKPKDYLTTTEDPEDRKTVMELVKNACQERIYPVGRLDRNTTGLLILTNDGDLAKKLTHPSHSIAKVYQVDLDKPFSPNDMEKLQAGITLEDGPFKADDVAIVSPDRKIVGMEIHEGRNRLVRRVFEALGYKVVKLDRVLYAGLTKKDLPRGHWRHLSEKEVIRLKHFA